MKGEKFVSMLNHHATVINAHARMLDRHQSALAYEATRGKAIEQVLTAGRFALAQVALREIIRPGSFKKAIDAAQEALIKPPAAPQPQEPAKGRQEGGK